MLSQRCLILICWLVYFFPATLTAQDLDCSAYENHPGIEPEGYARLCLEASQSSGGHHARGETLVETAFAHELRNTRNTVFHSHEDLSDSTIIGLSTSIVFGYDYNPELNTLYGINSGTGQFGTSDGITFTAIGVPTRPAGHTWSGLAIDPVSGKAFLSSTDSSVSTLQSVNLETGESTLIGNIGDLELVIEIAINCEGSMYAHDIGTDAIYSIDSGTGAPTLVGPHGLETNFAQGMDFNNRSGELYIYAYTGGGSVTYGTVSLVDGTITPLNVNDPEGEWEGASRTTCPGVGPARFRVVKDFNDDNPATVGIGIECNTGLPLSQHTIIPEGEDVTFVVDDFIDGELTCGITESVPAGYSATYNNGETVTSTGCEFEAVEAGSFQDCAISNVLEPVTVEVDKVWIDENPSSGSVDHARAQWACTNVAHEYDFGNLEFLGNPGSDSFVVYPYWNGGTHCSVSEVTVPDSNIESDDSACASVLLFPGSGGACTIYNTRLYAGIPVLNPFNLVALALLLLGLGLVRLRTAH